MIPKMYITKFGYAFRMYNNNIIITHNQNFTVSFRHDPYNNNHRIIIPGFFMLFGH